MKIIIGVVLILTLSGGHASARVFNFKNENLATYFRGTAGLSNLKKSGFEKSGGVDGANSLSFSDETNYNYTGEFGLLFSVSRMNVRLGLELFRPNAATNVEASTAAGTVLYMVDSTVLSYGGVFNLEFVLTEGDRSRLFVSGGAGYFNTTLKNDYRLTAAGQAAYPGVVNYVEEGSAFNYMGQASFGFEFLLSDSATAVFDAGYRYFLVNNLKHSRNAATLMGNIASGETMKNRDGSDRNLDLSGIWIGMALRFYIGL